MTVSLLSLMAIIAGMVILAFEWSTPILAAFVAGLLIGGGMVGATQQDRVDRLRASRDLQQ